MNIKKDSAFDTIFAPLMALCVIPVFQLIIAAALAVPMYLMWNAVAPIYFTFLPAAWMVFTWKSMWAMLFILYAVRGLIIGNK